MKKWLIMMLYALEATGVIIVDRITKSWALAIPLSALSSDYGWISFDLIYNRGVSWGMLHAQDPYQFMCVNGMVLIITGLVIGHAFMWFKAHRSIAGHVLIIAGSVSNLMDRYWYGGVIDFIHLHYHEWSWAIFNIADVAIVIGALIIAFHTIREKNVVTHI